MQKPLLIEIGVEELPAIPLLKILSKIEKSWQEILKENKFTTEFEFLYTPRRLTLIHNKIEEKQEDSTIEFFGPPKEIAIKENIPTKAGVGFAKKCGVNFEDLTTTKKGNQEFLYFKREEKGKELSLLLEDMLHKWLKSMQFGKMMRWGSRKDEFIRPIRWALVKLEDKNIDIELFGVKSNQNSYLHRMVSYEPKNISSIDNYEKTLLDGGVILNPKKREEMILNDFDTLEKEHNFTIERDNFLLKEVIAITEYPKALVGSFDELFLTLPPEVIIASMKEHQRYFAVFKDEKLTNKFIVVSNAYTKDYSKVIKGNERVLKPRLADALFFYNNDLKRGLNTNGLEKVQFIDDLGTLKDKIKREDTIALHLLALYMQKLQKETNKEPIKLENLMSRAINLAKADLMSEMVYEFTELQGRMGFYYAKALNEDSLIFNAIKEQYMPIGDGAELPSNLFSSIVAMSIKLDTIIGLFSVGKIPTGSKDPFALRRAVNGIIRIVIQNDLSFDIEKIIPLLQKEYNPFDANSLYDFILERLNKSIKANPSLISAVLSSGERDINKIVKKVEALNEIVEKENFSEQFDTFKRVANISKEFKQGEVNITLFKEKEEKELYNEFIKIEQKELNNYKEYLEELFSLKEKLDIYFENVLVNSEDKTLKTNRQNTIGTIYKAFKKVADISEISI